jgi:Tol biopolymer transport system component
MKIKKESFLIGFLMTAIAGFVIGVVFDRLRFTLPTIRSNNSLEHTTTILFLNWDTLSSQIASIYSMNGTGGNLQQLWIPGGATGTVEWDNTGNYFASGCSDPTKICIYDFSKTGDQTIYPPIEPADPLVTELSLPDECVSYLGSRGVNSISWSPDNSRIAVVCGDEENSNLCILGLDGASHCLGVVSGSDYISRAVWSPKDDIILIDCGVGYDSRRIELVDSEFKQMRMIASGWSPSWSGDGKHIAFAAFDEQLSRTGIAMVDFQGKNFKWVYEPQPSSGDSYTEKYRPNFDVATNCLGSIKISWSSDNKYLFVDASYIDECVYDIFRISVSTGEISRITTNILYYPQEPDFRP